MSDKTQGKSDGLSVEERDSGILGEVKPKATKNKAVAVGIAVIAVAGLTYATSGEGTKEEPAKTVAMREGVPYQPAAEEKPEEAKPVASQPQVEPPAREPEKVEVDKEDNSLLDASRRAPVLITVSATRQNGSGQNDQQLDAQAGMSGGSLTGGDGTGLGAKLVSTPLPLVRATVIQNLHLTVPKGTHIPCTLETAVSSDQPGLVTCVISRDVMGASGQVVLAEKGSKVIGEYEGGMQRGKARIFVLWTELRTPSGVVVQLNSPATDALGRSGFNGKIDNKFMERFGAAMLMSVLSDASGYAFDRMSGNSDVAATATQNSTTDAVSTILKETVNIEPTLYKNQGEAVSVLVARDLDFSGVYGLKRTVPMKQLYDGAALHNGGAVIRTPVRK